MAVRHIERSEESGVGSRFFAALRMTFENTLSSSLFSMQLIPDGYIVPPINQP
jgi:hypothetical protein